MTGKESLFQAALRRWRKSPYPGTSGSVFSTDPISNEDVSRAGKLARERDWKNRPTMPSRDAWTLETWDAAYGQAMQWRDWQTCDQMLAERESESWWPAERERLNAIPDPPGAGWSE